jgi:hypothetical protein
MGSENPSGADNQQETGNVSIDGILRDCTRGAEVVRTPVPTGGRRSRLKIQSDPHGDMGSQAEMIWPLHYRFVADSEVVTKVPKVGMPLCRQRGAAPRVGDNAMSSRLYAGNSGESSTTRRSRLIQQFSIVAA